MILGLLGFFRSARSKSPADRCPHPNFFTICSHWVPEMYNNSKWLTNFHQNGIKSLQNWIQTKLYNFHKPLPDPGPPSTNTIFGLNFSAIFKEPMLLLTQETPVLDAGCAGARFRLVNLRKPRSTAWTIRLVAKMMPSFRRRRLTANRSDNANAVAKTKSRTTNCIIYIMIFVYRSNSFSKQWRMIYIDKKQKTMWTKSRNHMHRFENDRTNYEHDRHIARITSISIWLLTTNQQCLSRSLLAKRKNVQKWFMSNFTRLYVINCSHPKYNTVRLWLKWATKQTQKYTNTRAVCANVLWQPCTPETWEPNCATLR